MCYFFVNELWRKNNKWSKMKVCTVFAGVSARFDWLARNQVKIGLSDFRLSVQLPGTEIVSAYFDKKL